MTATPVVPQPVPEGEVRREAGLAPPQPAGSRWRHAFRLASGYWTSPDWKFAWFALILLTAVELGATYLFVIANRWQQHFFDSVEQRDAARFGTLIFVFLGIMAMQVAQIMVAAWISSVLAIRWRTFLTHRYVDRWMARNRYAEIERLRMIDNPDQRIHEDINLLTSTTSGILTLALGLLGSVVSAVTFVLILLETAAPIRFTVLATPISIPGGTVWYAFAYALIGSLVTAKVGQFYIRATMRQQHREADFRSALIHVRRNAAQIGLAGAVPVERRSLLHAFGEVRRNYMTVIYSALGLTATQSVYERIGTILPLFVLVPRYFAREITFGQVMGGRDAFQQLVAQLSFFVMSFRGIGEQITNINRLKGLDDAIEDGRAHGIALTADTDDGAVIATSGLSICKPHGESLVSVGDWSVSAGERWAVCGSSGAGKSTLIRALAGLWPDGTGTVSIAAGTRVMFVPQRLYLPLGTLKAAVCFPDVAEAHDDASVAAVLGAARLPELADDLHAVRLWQEELSPGEQQRLALARILLHRPTLLVLDEATSALDEDNARHFYGCLRASLPGATILSVVHDTTLLTHHTHRLTIADGHARPERIGETYI